MISENSHRKGRIASDTRNTFVALLRDEVETLILTRTYCPDPGWACTNCGMTVTEAKKPDACYECGSTELRGFAVKDEMVRMAEQNHCEVEIVNYCESLSRLGGGVGCLLRQ